MRGAARGHSSLMGAAAPPRSAEENAVRREHLARAPSRQVLGPRDDCATFAAARISFRARLPALQAVPLWADATADVAVACVAAFTAAPVVTLVDQAVTRAAAGTTTLGSSLLAGVKTLFTRPHHAIGQPAFWLVFGVYGSTYAAANLIDTICERKLDRESEHTLVVHGAAKLVGTTAVNMGTSIAKDAWFARMFGAVASNPRAVPLSTIGCFVGRDTLTIGAAFTVPQMVAQALVTSGAMGEQRAAEAAQIIAPISMQLICSPLHLLALNLYNVPTATVAERASMVGKVLPQTTVTRMGRFMFAYGVSGILNTVLIHKSRDALLQHYYVASSEQPGAETLQERARPKRRDIIYAQDSAEPSTGAAQSRAAPPKPADTTADATTTRARLQRHRSRSTAHYRGAHLLPLAAASLPRPPS